MHLLGYCLIERVEDDYFVRIKSIEDYLKNKYYYEKQRLHRIRSVKKSARGVKG